MTNYRVEHLDRYQTPITETTFDPMNIDEDLITKNLKAIGLRDAQIAKIVRQIIRNHHHNVEEYEIKEMIVRRFREDVDFYLTYEVGLKGDEGTMAAIYARDSYHLHIGKKGGLKANDGKKWVSGTTALFTRSR